MENYKISYIDQSNICFAVFFVLVQGFEGGAAGLMVMSLVLLAFYVFTDRCRTKPVAIALLLIDLLAGMFCIKIWL